MMWCYMSHDGDGPLVDTGKCCWKKKCRDIVETYFYL